MAARTARRRPESPVDAGLAVNSLTVRSAHAVATPKTVARRGQVGAKLAVGYQHGALDADLLLCVQRHRREPSSSVCVPSDRPATVVRARRGEDQARDTAACASCTSARGLLVDLLGESYCAAHAGSPTIAARCTMSSTPSSTASGAPRRRGCRRAHLEALGPRAGRACRLSVDEPVHRADAMTARAQLLDHERADEPAPPVTERPLLHRAELSRRRRRAGLCVVHRSSEASL